MKFFTNAVARMYELPSRTSAKGPEITVNTIIEVLLDDGTFLEVIHNTRHGFILNTLANPYVESLPKNCVQIDTQTPELTDFEQYFLYRGLKQVNACGELSICKALGLTMLDFMDTWEIKSPSLFKRIMSGGRMRGTSKEDLRDMCTAYAVESKTMEAVTKDPYLNRSRYTPALLENLAETGYPIVGCKMYGVTGRLRGQGVGHWVMVTAVEPERMGGLVYLYNPAPNRIERYDWDQFIAATGNYPTGIWIPKE